MIEKNKIKGRTFVTAAIVIFLLSTIPLFSAETGSREDPVHMPDTVVSNTFEDGDFVGPVLTETNTKIKVTEKGLTTLGPASAMSPHKSIRMIPSVNQQSVDPAGLSDISNYHESFRFRGVEPTGGGNPSTPVNVENVPISGRPGGGVAIYDIENFETISIYKGGVPSDQAFGLTNIGGKIDMEVKDPKDRFSANIKQIIGSDRFKRTFLRMDTGRLPTNTNGFISYSNTFSDKWKGNGNSDRDNAMFGIDQKIGDRLSITAHGLYNKSDVNTYRALGYSLVSSLSKNYRLDFNNDKTDYYYYGYNRADFEDYSFFGNIGLAVSKDSRISIKPFTWNDSGHYLETITLKNGQNRIRRWDMDHSLSGVLAEYSHSFKMADVRAGYFYLEQERPGPPTSWKLYTVTDSGLSFEKWQILSNDSKHRQRVPFVSGKYTKDALTVEGGVKFLDYTMPEIITYNTSGISDVSYETAKAAATSIEANACADAKEFHKIIGNFGASYRITDMLSSYVAYGRNYGMSVALYPYFISQKSSFYEKGISLQDLWDHQELETADNFDLGFRFVSESLYIAPTLYYAKHKNKVAIYADSKLGVSFPANNAEAEACGFELEGGVLLLDNLSFYASFSYNRFYFSQDLDASGGTVLSVKGDQIPDAPEFLANAMVCYTIGNLVLSPMIKYTSKRYGDVLHEEKIDGVALIDLDVTYRMHFPKLKIRQMDMSLTMNNIFDEKYVSIINTSDYKTLGSTYQTGAPFTIYFALNMAI